MKHMPPSWGFTAQRLPAACLSTILKGKRRLVCFVYGVVLRLRCLLGGLKKERKKRWTKVMFDSIPRKNQGASGRRGADWLSEGAVRKVEYVSQKPIINSHLDPSPHGCIQGLKGCNMTITDNTRADGFVM